MLVARFDAHRARQHDDAAFAIRVVDMHDIARIQAIRREADVLPARGIGRDARDGLPFARCFH
jgi:hypothetical protein